MPQRPCPAPLRRGPAIRAAVLTALLPVLAPAHAVTVTWIGGSVAAPTSWSNPLNWLPQQVPPSAADTVLLFPNSFVAASNNISNNFQFNRISAFAGASGTASGTLLGQTLAPSGANAQIGVGGAGSLVINAALVGSGNWSKTGTGELSLGGANAGASGDITVAAGRLSATGSGTLGSGAITVNSGASLRTGGTQQFKAIAGAGSWQADGNVTLGSSGDGSFSGAVAGTANLLKTGDGRQVFAGPVALAGSVAANGGELALNGPGASWTGSTSLSVYNASTVSLADGAQWTTIGDLNVGVNALLTSRLSLAGGSRLSALNSDVGRALGERGQVSVDQANWVSYGTLTIANQGTGRVDLLNKATASAQQATLGAGAEGLGTLALTGSSSATITQGLVVGQAGSGLVTAEAASSFSSASAALGLLGSGTGTVNLTQGASWTNNGTLVVGSAGAGLLTIQSGSSVSSGSATVALLQAPTHRAGNVALDAGSWAVNGTLTVADAGYGLLSVDNGSTLTSSVAAVGRSKGGEGAVSLGGGLLASSWVNAGQLDIGPAGEGSVTVNAKGSLTTGNTTLGLQGGWGTLSLFGNASSVPLVTVNGTLTVGGSGSGGVGIAGGLLATTGTASIGTFASGGGSVTVATVGDAPYARWTVDGGLYVGNADNHGISGLLVVGGTSGAGQVVVSDLLSIGPGGQVSLRRGLLSVRSIASFGGGLLDWTGGTLEISGPSGVVLGQTPFLPTLIRLSGDQTLAVTKSLTVGNGTIVLADQAQVRAGRLSLDQGQVIGTSVLQLAGTTVVGRGAILTTVNSSDLRTTVQAQGGTLLVGNANDPNGFASRGSAFADAGSRLVLASAGLVDLGNFTLLRDASVLQTFNGSRLGAGGLLVGLGNATVLGRFTNEGSVQADLSTGVLNFNDDVDGSGSFSGDVRFRQHYAPGTGAQLDRLGLTDTATLVLGGLGAVGRAASPLLVSGLATLGGTLDLQFDPGFMPATSGSSFDLVDWGGYSGSFASLRVAGLDDGWVAQLTYGPDALRVSVSAVPEPATWLSLLAGTVALLASRRRAG